MPGGRVCCWELLDVNDAGATALALYCGVPPCGGPVPFVLHAACTTATPDRTRTRTGELGPPAAMAAEEEAVAGALRRVFRCGGGVYMH